MGVTELRGELSNTGRSTCKGLMMGKDMSHSGNCKEFDVGRRGPRAGAGGR